MSRQITEDIRGVYIYNTVLTETPSVTYLIQNPPVHGSTITVKYLRRMIPNGTENEITKTVTYGTSHSASLGDFFYDGAVTFRFKKPKNEKMMIKGISINYTTETKYAFHADKSKVAVDPDWNDANAILSAIQEQKVTKSISNISIAAGDYWLINFQINHSVDRVLGITGFTLNELVSGSDSPCGVMALSNLAVYHSTQSGSSGSGGQEIIRLMFANTSNRTVTVTGVSVTYKYLDLE